MSDISDRIQQYQNLSGIFTGAGGDRIPPHGTTHVKNGPDPIPQEIDGIPVDLEGMSTGETIVLDGDGNLVPGAALGALVSLQTAYDNGGTIALDDHDLDITLADGYEFKIRDAGGNVLVDVSDVSSVAAILLAADVLTLKDSNTSVAIAIASVGNPTFNTTDQSIIGAVNEVYAGATPLSHASTHENGGADEIDHNLLNGIDGEGTDHYESSPTTGNDAYRIADAITGNPDAAVKQRGPELIYSGTPLAGYLITFFSDAIATKEYVFALAEYSGSAYLVKFDRRTGNVIDKILTSSASGRLIEIKGRLVRFYAGSVTIYNQDDISDNVSVSVSSLLSSYGVIELSDGSIYNIGYSGGETVLQSVSDIFGPSPSATTVRTITEIAATGGRGRNLIASTDEVYLFIPTAASSDTLFKVVAATGVVNNSVALASSGFLFSMRANSDGTLTIVHDEEFISVLQSDMSEIDRWSNSDLVYACGGFYDNVFYNVPYDTTPQIQMSAFQLPCLTHQTPSHSDRSLQNSSSVAELRHQTTGERLYHSDSDFQRAAIVSQSLDTHRLVPGMRVLDVVASTDSKITNAVIGQAYLLSDTDQVFEKRSDGVHLYTPVDGDTIRQVGGQYTHVYHYDRWVKKVDMVLTATVVADGATTVTDIMTIDAGGTLYPQLPDGNEAWNVDIQIMVTKPSGVIRTYPTTAKWILSAAIQQGTDDSGTYSAAYINGEMGSVSFDGVDTPEALFETPVIECNEADASGDLRITVGVNSSATSGDEFTFSAIISGEARTGTPMYIVD